jgi:2'-5' RNA ligase
MKNIRTFVAVEVSPDVHAQAGQLTDKLRASGVKATWTKPHQLHLTLKFLGDTPETLLPEVCRAVSQACRGVASFEMRFGGAGAFPTTHRPQTLWLGATHGIEEISALQHAIDKELHQLRYPMERRRYVPHLTLGRTRGGTPDQLRELSALIESHANFYAGVSIVEEVIVFASYLDRVAGPTYQVLSRAELA